MQVISRFQVVMLAGLVAVISSWATTYFTASSQGISTPQAVLAEPDRLESVMAAKTLRCGYIEYPPYVSKDPNTGKMSGLMVDVMEQVAKKMNVKLEWSYETTWATMFEDLKMNRFDTVCSAVWQKTARAFQADFSTPIVYAPIQAWVRNGDIRFDGNLSAINNNTVTIPTLDGEMIETIAKEQFPQARTIALPQNALFTDVITNVATGKADVVFLEPKLAFDYNKANPNSLQPVADIGNIAEMPVVVILPKNNPDLKRVIDTAIAEIKNTAIMPLLLDKYELKGMVVVR